MNTNSIGEFRLWAFGDAHVGTDARCQRESLADALRQSEQDFEWDIAINVGDWAGNAPGPAEYADMDYVAPSRVHLRGEALRSCRAAYYGLINHVDDQMRRLLNPVTGLPAMVGDNTVIVFTSDHGEMLGDNSLWRKQQPYEPSAFRSAQRPERAA